MKPSPFLLTIALLPFGCGPAGQNTPASDPNAPASTAPASNPSRGSSAAAPAAPRAVPAERQPAAPAPTPRPRLIVPAGTLLPIEIQSTLSSDSSREGDAVLAILTESIALDGFTLDKGAEVRGRVFTAVPAKRVKGRARLVFGFEEVMENREKISISTEAIDTSGKSTGSKDKKIIGGSALGGLIVGAIKDGKKGAAIGTVIGAAAGGGAVLIMKGDEVEIPRGAQITVVVTQ